MFLTVLAMPASFLFFERNVKRTRYVSDILIPCVYQKTQSNGRAVPEPQEEAIVSEELVPHHQPPPSEIKAEKIPEVMCPRFSFSHSEATSATGVRLGSQFVTRKL